MSRWRGADPRQRVRRVGRRRRGEVPREQRASIPQLRQAILEYIEVHNEEGKPLTWSQTADEILDEVCEFGERTLEVHGDA